MPMMILNLALLFVFGLASVQLSFINREDLPHGAAEFGRWSLDLVRGSWHIRKVFDPRSIGKWAFSICQSAVFSATSIWLKMARSHAGCGTKFYGQRDFHADGSFITTEWVVILSIPLIPLRSMRVQQQGRSKLRFGLGWSWTTDYLVNEKLSLNWKQVLCTYALAIPLIAWGAFVFSLIKPHSAIDGNVGLLILVSGVLAILILPRVLRHRAMRRAGLCQTNPR